MIFLLLQKARLLEHRRALVAVCYLCPLHQRQGTRTHSNVKGILENIFAFLCILGKKIAFFLHFEKNNFAFLCVLEKKILLFFAFGKNFLLFFFVGKKKKKRSTSYFSTDPPRPPIAEVLLSWSPSCVRMGLGPPGREVAATRCRVASRAPPRVLRAYFWARGRFLIPREVTIRARSAVEARPGAVSISPSHLSEAGTQEPRVQRAAGPRLSSAARASEAAQGKAAAP